MTRTSYNSVELLGFVGADPQMYPSTENLAVTVCWLVTENMVFMEDATQEWWYEWHRVVAWGRMAELIYQSCGHGARLFIKGHLVTRVWQDAQQKRYPVTEVVAEEVVFLAQPDDVVEGTYWLPDALDRQNEAYAPPSFPDLETRRMI